MEGERDSIKVAEEKQDQEAVGEQDEAKKLEEELEKAKAMQEKKEGKKEMEEDNAKKKMEEELEEKAKIKQEIEQGRKKVEEEEEWESESDVEEWEWDGEGQEVGLIKNQEAGNSSIKKKRFVSKLASKISKKEKPNVDDDDKDPLTERLIKLEMKRELRWQAHRILGNGRNALGAFNQVLKALHDLKITNIKDLEPQHYMLEHPNWSKMPEPSASLAQLQNEFRRHLTRLLSEEGCTDLEAYKNAVNLLPSIKSLQGMKRLEEKFGHVQDSMSSLCGICQSPITEEDPFADQIALAVLDEYAEDFHRLCLDSWLTQPQPAYLPRVEHDPMCRNIIIFKLMDSWDNRQEIYGTREPETIGDEIFYFSEKNKGRFNKLIKKISSTNIDKRDKGIAELNNIRQDTEVTAEFKGFLFHNPEVIPALLHFLVTTATSINVEVQDNILTVVLHACNNKTKKKRIGKDPFIIPLIIIAIESELAVRIKVKCVAALITLSDLYYNKIKIGDLGAIRQLAKLLEENQKEAKKAAALAIVSLCMAPENHRKALEANMVDMAVRLIVQEIVVEESLMTLWLLRNSRPAMTALASHEMVEQCMSIVLRNPSNPIQPESIEVASHAFIQRDPGYYQIWRNIIAAFRKSLGSTGKEWWNFIM